MSRTTKRPQLRMCSFCQQVGHNRSTCFYFKSKPTSAPDTTTTPVVQTARQPIKFFVHHVPHTPPTSPHIVNLREHKEDIWSLIDTAAAPTNNTTLFHSYHQNTQAKPVIEKLIAKPSALPTKKTPELLAEKNHTPPGTNTPSAQPTKLQPKITFLQLIQNKIYTAQCALTTGKNYIHSSCGAVCQRIDTAIRQAFPWKRLATGSIVAALVFVLPTQGSTYYHRLETTSTAITSQSTDGFSALKDSTAALFQSDLDTASTSLTRAVTNFGGAVQLMDKNFQVLQTVASFIPGISGAVESRQALVRTGQELALGNSEVLTALTMLQKQPEATFGDRLTILLDKLKNTLPHFTNAESYLATVNPNVIPTEHQQQFQEFRVVFSAITNDMRHLVETGTVLKDALGTSGVRRYLLVFQNPAEMRATGGFLGSFAVVDIENGAIKHYEIPPGGTYDVQGQLDINVEPPAPLLLLNKRWEMQDANWFPDFAESAKKIAWFYRHSRHVTIDGVVAINAPVLERILSILGPITDDKRNITLTKTDALNTLQRIIEDGPDKKNNKPKQVLSDVGGIIAERLSRLSSDDLWPLLITIEEALSEKDIQLYFTDPSTTQLTDSYGWGGRLLSTPSTTDYLMVVNTNIQGQKSDIRIVQKVSHQTVVQDDGSIIDTVIISRTHTGNSAENLYGAPNIDYIRVYTPQGSTLLSASGFTWPDERKFKTPESWYSKDTDLTTEEQEISLDPISGTRITNEFNKTAFGNWIITAPGETTQVQFTYRLPFRLFENNVDNNRLLTKLFFADPSSARLSTVIQRQSGADSQFENQTIFPNGWLPSWKEGEDVDLANNGFTIPNKPLTHDLVFGAVLKKITK